MPQTTSRKQPGQHLIRNLAVVIGVVAVLASVAGFVTAVTG